MRRYFLLDPDVVFLNHGSFGACPRPVFETYQRWQIEMERQPVKFLGRDSDDLLDAARAVVAAYLHADVASIVFVPNATTGLNTVIRSLSLKPGDEILTSDHEYGALDKTWDFICGKTGAQYIHHPVPLPVTTHAALVESFWAAVTPQTTIIFLSHITSPTALTFPVDEICRLARQAGIMTIIDGAHVPGHIPLDLQALDPDFYSGNFHKWLCAPKGSAFLYARTNHHARMEPLVISHGWLDDSTFVSRNQWQGTRDIAAFLSVPAAIEFQREKNWDDVRQQCHELVRQTRERVTTLTELNPIAPDSAEWFTQMATIPLPACNIEDLKRRLYDEFRVEVPLLDWNGAKYFRVSIQGYNSHADIDQLLDGLRVLLPKLP